MGDLLPVVEMTTATELTRLLLGLGASPFSKPLQYKGMRKYYWYKQSEFSTNHKDLAHALIDYVGEGGYMIELGSFIGNSATAWAQAMRRRGLRNCSIVCIDTWLGDANMWRNKQKAAHLVLGPTGSPRLYEQFMLNIQGTNISEYVVPLRATATVGLRYIAELVREGRMPRPRVIYLDAAHEYPETQYEATAAWDLLEPGGFLVGDDYSLFWPAVQQSINEFVSRRPSSEFERPRDYFQRHKFKFARRLLHPELLDNLNASQTNGGTRGRKTPLALKESQWILRKARKLGMRPTSHNNNNHSDSENDSSDAENQGGGSFMMACCLNGWHGFVNHSHPGPLETCNLPNRPWEQDTCAVQGGVSGTTNCRHQYGCRVRRRAQREPSALANYTTR